MLVLVAFAGCAISLFGAAGFISSLKPQPEEFTDASGAIEEVKVQTNRISKSEVRFRLQGDGQFFSYPIFYPKYHWLAKRLAPGKLITLKYRPGDRSDLWALQLDEDVILTARGAAVAHRRNGYIGLGLALLGGIAAYVLFRASRDLAVQGE